MSDEDGFESERTWLRRAAVMVRREPDLRWKAPGLLFAGLVGGALVNAYEYGIETGVVLDGLGWGIVAGLAMVFIMLDSRMESVFPEYGDDDETEESDDSLRAKYVRGEIDHETFRRRLDAKLREPMDESADTANAPEAVGQTAGTSSDTSTDASGPVETLQDRFARGEIDEQEYRDRLATLRETGVIETADEADSVGERV
jgi:uncharacterized membrane protein